jgi:hypothetical protein
MDVVRHHIIATAQLMAVEASPYSIHVLVMATEEMIRKIAASRGKQLSADYRIFIKDEFQQEYLTKLREAYNWFKHADRDADASYAGPSAAELAKLNDIQTLLNIRGLLELGEATSPIFGIISLVITTKYPEYVNTDMLKPYPELLEQHNALSRDPEVVRMVLRSFLKAEKLFPSEAV